jgi:hypothetical protein
MHVFMACTYAWLLGRLDPAHTHLLADCAAGSLCCCAEWEAEEGAWEGPVQVTAPHGVGRGHVPGCCQRLGVSHKVDALPGVGAGHIGQELQWPAQQRSGTTAWHQNGHPRWQTAHCMAMLLVWQELTHVALTLQCGSKMARSLPDTKLGRSVRW